VMGRWLDDAETGWISQSPADAAGQPREGGRSMAFGWEALGQSALADCANPRGCARVRADDTAATHCCLAQSIASCAQSIA